MQINAENKCYVSDFHILYHAKVAHCRRKYLRKYMLRRLNAGPSYNKMDITVKGVGINVSRGS
jgi:hypothetical protein